MQKINPLCQVNCGQSASSKRLKQEGYINEIQNNPKIYINPFHVHIINI